MMPDSFAMVMKFLMGGVAFIFVTIIGVIVFSALKRTEAHDSEALPESVTTAESAASLSAQTAPAQEQKPKEVNLKSALQKTEAQLFGRIKALFHGDESNSHIDEIEEVLYTSDLGPQTVQRLMEVISENLSKADKKNYQLIRETLKKEITGIFSDSLGDHKSDPNDLFHKIQFAKEGPTVLMVVGVNGAGKTTSIGKVSAQLAQQGKKVLVAAGDTFRAAAGNQLKVWTERAQVEIFSPEGVSDPGAVAFDAIAKAKAQNYDIVIIDTAGRLHTQANLMEELKKVKRVMTKVIAEAPHETLIVLDANNGQNALMQAKEFHQALGLTGAILTKMDGTAKGGVAVGLAYELKIPIKLIGIGERIEDLRPFSYSEFVDSIFSD